jgi:divalent metal cation (Fe/Co/Zn/Cd) transporter
MNNLTKGIVVEWSSIIWTVAEAIMALVAGIMAHSISFTAFGLDSILELVAGFVVIRHLYVERKGKCVDNNEKSTAWTVVFCLFGIAAWVIFSSIRSIFINSFFEPSTLSIVVAVAASIIMPLMWQFKKRIAASIPCTSLKADSLMSLICSITSWIILIDVLIELIFGWKWFDSIAALGITAFIIREGIETIQEIREIK